VKIAFHHKNIPKMIHEFEECSKFINFDEFLKDSKISFENTSIKEKEMIGDLFDHVKMFKNINKERISKEDKTKLNMDLIHWTKRYADEILDK